MLQPSRTGASPAAPSSGAAAPSQACSSHLRVAQAAFKFNFGSGILSPLALSPGGGLTGSLTFNTALHHSLRLHHLHLSLLH